MGKEDARLGTPSGDGPREGTRGEREEPRLMAPELDHGREEQELGAGETQCPEHPEDRG